MTKARLKEKLAEQKRICQAMSLTIQQYHGWVDVMKQENDKLKVEIISVKVESWDLLSRDKAGR